MRGTALATDAVFSYRDQHRVARGREIERVKLKIAKLGLLRQAHGFKPFVSALEHVEP
jgi:hypothetical protein